MGVLRKNKFLNLNMGLVKENYAIVNKKDINQWKERGFLRIKKHPIFHYTPNSAEVIMLGKPWCISDFDANEYFRNSKIIDICPSCGSYGMGGPMFFGIKIQGAYGIRWLTYCIWCAGEHLLLDDRVIECHSDFLDIYSPWINFECYSGGGDSDSLLNLKNMLSGLLIEKIQLDNENIFITIGNGENISHMLCSHKYSDSFPEQGGTRKKRNSFEDGVMSDYWLVTYDETILKV